MAYSVVVYLPALHRGYLDLFKKYPGKLYILGTDFLKNAPRLERDIRALAPEEARAMVASLGLYEFVVVLDGKNVAELRADPNDIVLPDEELSRQFAKENLTGRSVVFVPVFLRWDRTISTTESEVPPDRIISRDDFHKKMLAVARDEAAKSPDWWRQIGAVLVRDGAVVFLAHNAPLSSEHSLGAFGDPRSNFDAGEGEYKDLSKFLHAEAAVIARAARLGVVTDGASLYVTTFPCPACAKSVVAAGIMELYYEKGYSLLDAEDILRAAGVKIVLVK